MPTDKLLHLLAGATVFAIALPFGLVWAKGAVILAAVAKEAYDAGTNLYAKRHGQPAPHTVDWADAGATLLGGLFMHIATSLAVAAASAPTLA